MYFPVLLALFDGDRDRVRRYLMLYVWAWVGIGTVFAAIFMSGGPIYHQRLTGDDMFAPLHAALTASGIADSTIGRLQDSLWAAYSSDDPGPGSGISAFPSVHFAVACVISLYLADRWRRTVPAAIVAVALYQVLSVHLGWHYAIDGYFSIATVLALRAGLRRSVTLRRPEIAASA